jgi:phage terminase small subunit
MAEKQSELIADQNEVLQYLTSVMRGQSQSEVIVVEGIGDGCSEARAMEKAPDEKERLKAAELLGKRYGLYTDKVDQQVDMDLNIVVDYGDGSDAD